VEACEVRRHGRLSKGVTMTLLEPGDIRGEPEVASGFFLASENNVKFFFVREKFNNFLRGNHEPSKPR